MTNIDQPAPGAPPASNGFGEIFSRFWGFEKLVGSALIKFLYYAGLAIIAIWTVFAVLGMGLGGFMGGRLGGGLVGVLGALLLSVVWVVLWRVVCEWWLLAYMFYNRLGEIRDRLPR